VTVGPQSPDPQQLRERYGPWALVAGGSEGVGAAFAEQLGEAGINLVLVARSGGPLLETAQRVHVTTGVEVVTVAADLTTASGLDSVLAACRTREVGLVVWNAGANPHSADFLDSDADANDRLIELNIHSPLRLIREVGVGMRRRRRGGILLVGSMVGYLGSVHHTVYGGAKAFLRVAAESLWLELRESDVDVLYLSLGVTRTPAAARFGLAFDVPGMNVAEPRQVAAEGLAHLPHGPVRVVTGNEAAARVGHSEDRASAVLGAHQFMQQLLEQHL
jgi:short-subunit dehydrogenase